MESDMSAYLSGSNVVCLKVRKNYWAYKSSTFRLYQHYTRLCELKPFSRQDLGDWFLFSCPVTVKFQPGLDYYVADIKNEFVPLDISYVATTPEFDKEYRYDGQLGAIYGKDKTVFRVFAPLANELYVRVRRETQIDPVTVKMDSIGHGVLEATVPGDWDGAGYYYFGKVNGVYIAAPDPYSFALSANARKSYVVDLNRILAIKDDRKALAPIGSVSKSVIYECSVRDMTSKVPCAHPSTYEALGQTGLLAGAQKTYPAGLDYIKSMGFNYVQIMPCMDFQTIDEDDPKHSYNWGYDPLIYFAPEGSYATKPNDPYSRLVEFKTMVKSFHDNGIRVNMDVVFNHVFDMGTNPLEILCPGYYFRRNADGTYSNGSFCGNDIESRHYMASKLIQDCLCHYVKVFGVDGFRFDLMGIIDKATIAAARTKLLALNKEIMMYGEGWDMPTALPAEEKTSSANAASLPDIGFFSDIFRDSAKGPTSRDRLGETGYLTGNGYQKDTFKFAYAGCCFPLGRTPVFVSPTQAIDYVECHDNNTLFDKLKASCPGEDEATLLKRVKMINAAVLLAAGIPFIHAGQEVGLSKKGNDNSFDAGDAINGFDYAVAEKRDDMRKFMADLIAFRKAHGFFSLKNKDDVVANMSFVDLDKNALMIKYKDGDSGYYYVLINPSKEAVSYRFPNYVKIVFNESGLMASGYDFFSQLVMLNALSVTVCYAHDDNPAD